MKTKGNWVIKYEDGSYFCGNNLFDSQIRKAQIYHWKEAAEESAESLRTRRYSKVADTKWEVVSVIPPRELKELEASWYQAMPDDVICSNCEYSALNDYRGNPVKSKFCPNCGKLMINSDVPED